MLGSGTGGSQSGGADVFPYVIVVLIVMGLLVCLAARYFKCAERHEERSRGGPNDDVVSVASTIASKKAQNTDIANLKDVTDLDI
mmetsp:Transcript_531/g.1599  ORF Transcript_531/g.1599 Transcript_531/m.1599 type:complete len:85 (-) Transcript_531:316-570(-)